MNLEKKSKVLFRQFLKYIVFFFIIFTFCGVYFVSSFDIQGQEIFIIFIVNSIACIATIAILRSILNISVQEAIVMENSLQNKINTQVNFINKQQKHLINQSKFAAMGEMLAMIAHQWRQPLNVIILNLNSIKIMVDNKKIKKVEFDAIIENVTETVDHMNTTIDDFRDFLKKEETVEDIPLLDLLITPKNLIEAELNNSKVKFTIDSNIDTDQKISLDKSKFFQVIMNLYKNSIDEFKKIERDNPYIIATLFEVDNSLVISIEDNAGGIPLDIFDKIFDPYFSTKGKNGTGLGLYMSKRIIEEYIHGTIEAINTQKGVKFTLTIPFKTTATEHLYDQEFKCFRWDMENNMFQKIKSDNDKECHLKETKEIVNMLNSFSISYEITDNYDIKLNF